MKKVLFVLLIILGLMALPVEAADISLAWDANDVAPSGYRIYAANASGDFDYTTPLYEGVATTCTVTVADSVELKFVARAYLIGTEGAVYESADSNVVQHAVVVWSNPNLRVQ